MKNETKLIASTANRQLTAYGKKLMYRLITKAAQKNGSHCYSPSFRQVKDKIKDCFYSLVFDQNLYENDIAEFVNSIKIEAHQSQTITTSQIFKVN